MAYRLALGDTDTDYVFPESLTYNLVSFASAVPSAKLPRAHGARVPRGYLAERRIEIRGLLKAGIGGDSLQTQLDALRAGLMSGPTTLWVANARHFRNVQKDDSAADRYENTWPERIVDVSADLITGDPFMYSDAESSDLNNTIAATGDNVVVNNAAGNAPAAPMIALTVQGEGADFGELPTTGNKGATLFTEGTDESDTFYFKYVCLNGDYLTLWVDERGSLVPRRWASGSSTKPVGIATATLITPANMGADGEILPADGTMPGYGLAWSATPQGEAASTEAGIEARRELLTCGAGSVASGWSLTSDHVDLGSGGVYYRDTDVTAVTAFTASGANAGSSPLSATSTCKFQDSGLVDLLEVKHIFSFQEAATALAKTRVKVRVELRNLTGTPITGVRYAHVIDPNPATTSGTTTHGIGAGNPSPDADAFAIYGISGGHFVGIGVYNDGDNVQGVCLATTPGVSEAGILSDPPTQITSSLNILLGSGTNADYRTGNSVTDSTTNFKTDTAWQANALASSGERALLLLTDGITIAGSATEVFEFYLFTDISNLTGGEGTLSATITNETTGEAFTLNGTVEAGTVIEVDTLEETVMVDGEDRTDLFDGLFPLLAVGNNTLDIAFDSGEVTNVDVTWRNRWY